MLNDADTGLPIKRRRPSIGNFDPVTRTDQVSVDVAARRARGQIARRHSSSAHLKVSVKLADGSDDENDAEPLSSSHASPTERISLSV